MRAHRKGFFLLNRVVNPLVRLLLRSPMHPVLSRRLALITVTGRRTEQRFTIPVGYRQEVGVVTVHVGAPDRKRWWRNLRGGAPVAVRLAGRDHRGWATVHGDVRSGVSVEIALTERSGRPSR
jgi:F420H(2)-dependent quinone reductase